MAYRDTGLLGRTFGSLDHRSRWLSRAMSNQLNRNDAQQPNHPIGFSSVPGVYEAAGSVGVSGSALARVVYPNYNGSGTLAVGAQVDPFLAVRAVSGVSPSFTMSSSVGGPAQQHIVRAPLSSVWWLFYLSSSDITKIFCKSSPDLLNWKDGPSKNIAVASEAAIGHDDDGRQLNVTLAVLGGKEVVHAVVVSKAEPNRSDSVAWTYDMRAVVSGDVLTWDAGESMVDQNANAYLDGVPESPAVLVRGDGTLAYITTNAGNPNIFLSNAADTGQSNWTPDNISILTSLEVVNNYSKMHYLGHGSSSSPLELVAIWQAPGDAPDTASNMRYLRFLDTVAQGSPANFFFVTSELASRRYAFCQDNAGNVYGFRIGNSVENNGRKLVVSTNTLTDIANSVGSAFPNLPAGVTPYGLSAAFDGLRYVVVFLHDTQNTVWSLKYDPVDDRWVQPWWNPLFRPAAMTIQSTSTTSINNSRGRNAVPVLMQFGQDSSDIWVGSYMLGDDFGLAMAGGHALGGVAVASMTSNAGSSFTESMTGQIAVTGLASQRTSGIYGSEGTTTLTGLASQLTSGVYEASGGVTATGSASQRDSGLYIASGNLAVTGLSSQLTSGTYVATGGVTVTGQALQRASGVYEATGTTTLIGTATYRTSGTYSASGDIVASGVCSHQHGMTWAAAGSLAVTGTSTEVVSGAYAATGATTVSGASTERTSGACFGDGSTTISGLWFSSVGSSFVAGGNTSISGTSAEVVGGTYTADGGVATISGASTERTSGVYVAEGAVVAVGQAQALFGFSVNTSGTLAISGESTERTGVSFAAEGGQSAGGEASQRTGGMYAAGGPLSLFGTAISDIWMTWGAEGFVSLAGTVTAATTGTFDGVGAATISGEAGTRSSTQASQTGQGGLTLTGTPDLVASYAYQAGGDVSTGGSATPAASYGDQPGLGTTSITGSTDLQVGYAHVPSGGHYLSGDAALAATYAYATVGSLSVTGEATERTEGSYAGTAGTTLGGTATQQTSGVFGSTGEVSASGTAVVAASYYYAGDGYLAASGSATPQAGAAPQLGGGGLAATGSVQLDGGMAWAADGGTSLSGTPFLAASYTGYQGFGAVTFSGFADGQGANSYSTTMNGGLSFSGSCLRGGTVAYLASGDVVILSEALQTLSAVAETVAGPTSLSGSSGVSAGMAWASSGGTAVSGFGESRTGGIAGGSGGVTLTGGHVAYATALVNGTGGASLSGAALVYGTATFAASGELAVGGVGHAGVLFLVDGSGVLSLGGLSPVYATMAYDQAGSCSLSGSALLAVSVSHAATGGVSMSGTATASAAVSAESFGGVALHGVGAYGVSAAVGGNGVFRVEGEAVARVDLGGVASLGGTSLAGSAGTRSSGLSYGEGDQAVRGEAAYVVSGRSQASGTCLIGGSADATQGFYLEVGGTLTASGTAGTPSIGYVFQSDGGFAASSEDTFRWAVEASGGLVFSGVNIVALPSYEREGGGSLGLSGKSYCHLTTGRLILWESSPEPDKGHSSAAGNSLAMAVAAGTAAGSIVPGPESGGRPDELPQAAAATGNSLADTIAAAAAAQRKAAAVTPLPPSGGRTMSLSAA